ncbi:MAG: glycosyltransferase family 2 protein [Deltaproteobacteria bacterium]|nr:glycosyltransferase family 2 protein [Deltaproteobacteria bacterium]MBW2304758.1 glycosyltransferase family 2 protein [Deltaproteobacteria bacterium]
MKGNRAGIVIISPVKDESAYIGRTIRSVLNQTFRPSEWVIVDDGSEDDTARLVREMTRGHDWIRLLRKPGRSERAVGPGVVEAFYFGYERIRCRNYEYICKMDGDLSFGSTYFEHLLRKFREDPRLGAASGKLFLFSGDHGPVEERIIDESVLGGLFLARRKCFEDIGGFVREVMWDGIAFHRCRMAGWRTRSFRDHELRIIHHRMMGSSHRSVFNGRIRWGRGQYFMGTHPLYILASGCYRMAEKPYILGGLLIIAGYFLGWIKRHERYGYPGFRESLRTWQLERLKLWKHMGRMGTRPKTDKEERTIRDGKLLPQATPERMSIKEI